MRLAQLASDMKYDHMFRLKLAILKSIPDNSRFADVLNLKHVSIQSTWYLSNFRVLYVVHSPTNALFIN